MIKHNQPRRKKYDAIVIGGGFYGCCIAIKLARENKAVLIIEKENDFLQKASINNQARVHGGYHYSRHFLTALRSQINYPKFEKEYKNCIVDNFEMNYAVARHFSKTNATQFLYYMKRTGAPIEPSSQKIKKIINPQMIEEVFRVRESAFDAVKLKHQLINELQINKVDILLQTQAIRVKNNPLCVEWQHLDEKSETIAGRVYNCSYSQINNLLQASNIPSLSLQYEYSEICLTECREELRRIGFTVMCGPFFSIMPFPTTNAHSLSHVRYTPHFSWQETKSKEEIDLILRKAKTTSHFGHMLRDASRFIPLLAESKYVKSIWEIKTFLPQNNENDGRPILCTKIETMPGLTCVMGGKIDNIYDVYHTME